MSDSDFVASLRAHVREEQRENARLEEIARGQASPAEPTELEAACAALAPAAVDRIVAKVQARVDADARGDGKVVPITPSRWGRRASLVAGPLALAAAVALYVSGGPTAPSLVELPGYGVTARGESVERAASDPASSPRLRVGSGRGSFEIVLQPEKAVRSRVVAYAFTAAEAGEPRALDAKVEVAVGGSVRVTGQTQALAEAAEVRIVVGNPEALASASVARDRARSPSAPSRGLRVVTVAIDRAR